MRIRLAIATLALISTCPSSASQRPILFSDRVQPEGSLVIPLASVGDLARASALDPGSRAAVQRALTANKFDFEAGSTLMLHALGPWDRILVVGTGTEARGPSALQDVGGTAAQELGSAAGPVTILANSAGGSPSSAAEIAIGARLGGYSFDKYKHRDPKTSEPGTSAPITIVGASPAAVSDYQRRGAALAEAVTFARDLATEPANILYPEAFVERTREAFHGVPGVRIQALDVPAMQKLGMGSILSVGQGSARPPRMLVVEYRGGGTAAPLVLAGKGITFDSGGLSIKPGTGMWAMKGDMGGAAAVVGAALSLARSRAPVNVVAIAALAENMPSGSAARPGDVVRAMNGRTIEILNTDAEGRLVLADAMVYAERQFRPAAIIDIATLTGAVTTALSDEYAGLFSRNEPLAAQLAAAGAASGEEVWRLPLHPNYAKDMKSDIADIKNVVEGGSPGAGLGAHFIGYFVESTPWAHIDIAGMDLRTNALPTVPKGFSAFGVRLLDRFVRDFRPVPTTATGTN